MHNIQFKFKYGERMGLGGVLECCFLLVTAFSHTVIAMSTKDKVVAVKKQSPLRTPDKWDSVKHLLPALDTYRMP